MKIRSRVLTSPQFTLYPLSDVHWPRHDEEKLGVWREQVLRDKTAIVTLGGDLFDFARGHYRAHLRSYTADNNSQSPLDNMAYSDIEGMAAFLKPVAKQGKVLMTCVGNHFYTFPNGRVSDQELALQLEVGDTFVGAFGMARMRMAGRQNVLVALHHDAGRKGGTISSDLLAFQHWSHQCAADIYVAGHTHRQYAGVFHTRITVDKDEDKVGARYLVFLRSGAFLKGYQDSVTKPSDPFIPDYAEVSMLAPSVLGLLSVRVEATPKGKLLYTLQQRTL